MNRQCQNPECRRPLPDDAPDTVIYCREDCQKKHLEIQKQNRKDSGLFKGKEKGMKLTSEENLWLGQERRKRAVETIIKIAKEVCPMPYKQFACLVSFRTGFCLRKVTDDYLDVLIQVGQLKRVDNTITLGEAK